MPTLRLFFRGPFSHDALRGALGDALTALGAPGGAWEALSHEVLPDRNSCGGCFHGTWRRGDATLEQRCASGDGNPRDGWGYDHTVTLRWGDRALRWEGGSTSTEVFGFLPEFSGSPDDFRTLRATLARVLGGDDSDIPSVARGNLAALEGVDEALQRTTLEGALAQATPQDHALPVLLQWKERLLGGTLDERLRAAPADFGAWAQAAATPPPGWEPARIAEIRARLSPWDPTLSSEGVARAWRSHPLLGRGRKHPRGWLQLEDGHGPGWPRHALTQTVITHLFGPEGLASAQDGPTQHLPPTPTARGWGVARAVWTRSARPLVHARCQIERPRATSTTFMHWIWGEGPDDVVVIAREVAASVELGVGLFVAGSDDFQRRARAAVHVGVPFAWRPVKKLFEERAPRTFAPDAVTRDEVSALIVSLDPTASQLADALRACGCAEPSCAHRTALRDAHRALRRRPATAFPRAMWQARALEEAYAAALAALDGASTAPRLFGEALKCRAIAGAVTDAPSGDYHA